MLVKFDVDQETQITEILVYVDAGGSNQHKTITEVELRVCNFSAETALQQPESELRDINRETGPVRNITEPREDSTLCSVGRGALSLEDLVKAPGGDVVASSASKKRNRSRPGVRGGGSQQQAQTHSSGEESYNPSFSFMAVCRTPVPPLAPLSRNAEVDKEQRSETDARASIQGCAQDPIVLESPNMQKDGSRVEETDTSNSRKRKHPSHEPSKDYEAVEDAAAEIEPDNQDPPTSTEEAPDTSISKKRKYSSHEPSKDHEAVRQSEEAQLELDTSNSRKRKSQGCAQDPIVLESPDIQKDASRVKEADSRKRKYPSHEPSKDNEAVRDRPNVVEIEPSNQHQSSTTVKELHSTTPSQVAFVPNSSDHEVAEIDHSTEPAVHGNVQERNQNVDSLVDTGLEDCSAIDEGRGAKRKPEAITPPPARNTTPGTSRCPTCQAPTPPPVESNWATARSRKYRNVDVPYSEKDKRLSERPRQKEWDIDKDYSWLDTYTHVVPPALTRLAAAMRSTSFSFSDFGIFREFGASVNASSGTGSNSSEQG